MFILYFIRLEEFFSRLTVSTWIHRRLHSGLQNSISCQVVRGEEHLLRQKRCVQHPISHRHTGLKFTHLTPDAVFSVYLFMTFIRSFIKNVEFVGMILNVCCNKRRDGISWYFALKWVYLFIHYFAVDGFDSSCTEQQCKMSDNNKKSNV